MKKLIFTTSIAAVALAAQASAEDLTNRIATETSCKKAALIATTNMNASSEIATVTATLETALKAKSSCACEIVTAVIEATGADGKDKAALISAIVETAIKALPEETATITECAVAAAPAHAGAIEKVLTKVYGSSDSEYLGESSKNGYSKQAYGKGEVEPGGEIEPEPAYPVYTLPAPVYLIAPSGGIVAPGELVPLSPSSPSPSPAS